MALILAAATTAGTSTDVTLAAGVYGRVSIFTSGVNIPAYAKLYVNVDTDGADATVAVLTAEQQSFLLTGPGTFRVFRPAQEVAIGVSSA
jgi:hypothetical protein